MKRLRKTVKQTRNSRGLAMLIAIFSMTLMLFIAVEVSYDANVEYVVSSQQVNRLRAYYAAKSGVELSLLRVLIYKKALAQFGEQLKGNTAMLDPIWQFPFTWPPAVPDDISGVDKTLINDVVKESSLKAQYAVTIESEGGKIDINDLGSESKKMAESVQAQVIKIFEQERENNDDFRKEFDDVDFNELVNNIADWVDADSESKNGGDERDFYRDVRSEFIPPNMPFRTLEELHMVAGMQDGIFKVLAPKVTVFGIKGVNVNYAPQDVLKSLDPQITDEIVAEIVERRSNPDKGGPFKDLENDFLPFIESVGVNTGTFNEAEIPLFFDAEYNFRIKSAGQFANSIVEVTAITYDYEGLQDRYIAILDEIDKDNGQSQENEQNQNENAQNNNNENQNNEDNKNENKNEEKKKVKVPTGRPTVVYWREN